MSHQFKTTCVKLDPDTYKLELRRRSFLHEINCPSTSYAQACERSFKLWTAYEQINRDFFPTDPVYSLAVLGGISTTKDACAYGSAGTAVGRVMEVMCGGLLQTASAVNRVTLQRSNAFLGAGTFSASSGIGFFNDLSPNPTGVFTNAGSQGLLGNPLLSIAYNAWNGAFRWVALPQCEIYVVNGERVALRSLSGTPTVGATLVIEEL